MATISGGNTLVAHDRNGCMTKIPKPLDNTSSYTLVYDAWNRLTQVKDGTTVVATYVYDARNHRIKKTVGDETRLYYFNQQWQCVEERVGTTVDATWIYGLRYIDDVVCRVKNTEVLYALQDPNWNVIAVLNSNGSVAERMTYDSFGRVTFRNSDFTTKTTSSYNWTKTFTGQVYDTETGLMLYRNRYYHPGLGRFITRDPIGYDGDSVNLYRYVENNTVNKADPLGEDWLDCVTDCVEANDPTIYLLKAALLVGGNNTKFVAAQIFRLAGRPDLATKTMELSGKGLNKMITNNWSIIAALIKDKKTKVLLRRIGDRISPFATAYGLALAYIQSHCVTYCTTLVFYGCTKYDHTSGAIDHTIWEYWIK